MYGYGIPLEGMTGQLIVKKLRHSLRCCTCGRYVTPRKNLTIGYMGEYKGTKALYYFHTGECTEPLIDYLTNHHETYEFIRLDQANAHELEPPPRPERPGVLD